MAYKSISVECEYADRCEVSKRECLFKEGGNVPEMLGISQVIIKQGEAVYACDKASRMVVISMKTPETGACASIWR